MSSANTAETHQNIKIRMLIKTYVLPFKFRIISEPIKKVNLNEVLKFNNNSYV